jgi:hypothetical protein
MLSVLLPDSETWPALKILKDLNAGEMQEDQIKNLLLQHPSDYIDKPIWVLWKAEGSNLYNDEDNAIRYILLEKFYQAHGAIQDLLVRVEILNRSWPQIDKKVMTFSDIPEVIASSVGDIPVDYANQGIPGRTLEENILDRFYLGGSDPLGFISCPIIRDALDKGVNSLISESVCAGELLTAALYVLRYMSSIISYGPQEIYSNEQDRVFTYNQEEEFFENMIRITKEELAKRKNASDNPPFPSLR